MEWIKNARFFAYRKKSFSKFRNWYNNKWMAHLFKDVETFQKVMNMLTITTLPRCALNVIIRVLLAIRIIANQVLFCFHDVYKMFHVHHYCKNMRKHLHVSVKTQTKILHSLHLELWNKTFILVYDEFDVQ